MPTELKTQLTIVSHYGHKPEALIDLIVMLQNKLSLSLGSAFRPYEMEQVHGTIIGLEGTFTNRGILSKWFKDTLEIEKYIEPSVLLDFLRSGRLGEVELKIGGWQSHEEYGFRSRDQHPFLRSFSIQGEITVAMGWPFHNGKYSDGLYMMRKSFEEVNILHKWHKGNYRDNDFFFVLGRIDKRRVNPFQLQQIATEIRVILAGIDERVQINKDTVSIVAYVDTQLPLTTSEAFSLNDPDLTPELISQLYQQSLTMRCT